MLRTNNKGPIIFASCIQRDTALGAERFFLGQAVSERSRLTDEGNMVEIGYRNFSNAFDAVNNCRPGWNPQTFGITGTAEQWMRQILSGVNLAVREGNYVSESEDASSKAPKCCVLRLTLFLLFTHDLVQDSLTHASPL